MRILVLGGTRFLGLALVRELLEADHAVCIVHRGVHEPDELRKVEHIHVERAALRERRQDLARFRPDVAIDLAAMTEAEAEATVEALDPTVRLLAASSGDVYRACASVFENRVTDAVPLREDAPLREGPTPDREFVPPGWAYDPEQYEKLDVERVFREAGGAICRLPMIYGEHDYKRREDFILRRVRAGRTRIPVGVGSFLWSRGYAPELARGIRLAAEIAAAGEIFNLAELTCAPIRLWIEQILAAADCEAELVPVPEGHLPEDLAITGETPQPWLMDATKAARRLDWVHAPAGECVAESVRWHLDNPPPPEPADFSADDAALAAAASMT
ncbi:MAG TPA: NAD-dependent epimerase/dehydratase family protein [Solirubrobacterales bacterium]|nr:NAD-dependent epimerase/dehydratase family protein [Solirubrobacterales bacterium]